MTPTTKLLRELIAIPSVNPAFLGPMDPRGGEGRVSEFLLAVAAKAGLEVEFQPVYPGRKNLLARLVPHGPIKQRVVLAPHLDTVGAEGNQFKPVVKNGRVHGRGACDTKGSVASMLGAMMDLAKTPLRPRSTEIIFAGLVDEENGQGGSRALAASGFRANLAIVGEPTRLKGITAHKGDMWIRVETFGKTAHGAKPELGKNAVLAMARVVELLETVYGERLKRKVHPILGHGTSNVGQISGGKQPNIVPDHCEIVIDRRTLPGEDEKKVIREIETLLKKHGVKARISNTKSNVCRPLETNPDQPLVRSFLQLLQQKRPLGVDYFCDAAILGAAGTPSVVFGPGDIADAHTVDESIDIDELEQARLILGKFLASLP